MINLLLTDDSLPVGGKETLLLHYLKRLDRDKFRVHLVTLTSKGELIAVAKEYSDNYFCVERKAKFDLKGIYRLRQYFKKNKIQVIHTNQWIDSLYVFIASFNLKLKKISTIHGYISGWRRCIHRVVLRQFDRVVCVSESSRKTLINQGYLANNLIVIYNGIDTANFRRVCPYSSSSNSFVVGMIGSFRKERDHLTLLKAIHYLIKYRKKKIELRFVGGSIDPQCESEVERYSLENGLDQYVRFLGSCRDISRQLSELDVYVASSYSETFGLALMEAMACGLPVTVSGIPAFLELIEHGRYGLYFQTGDYEDLAQKIEELMDNKSLRQYYGALAFRRSKAFSIDSSLKKMQALYADLLDF